MKSIKLSKTSWLILSAGIFVVILAGLGLTRSQQMQDQTASSDELELAVKRLDNIDVSDLRTQVQSLQEQIDLGKTDLQDAISRLDKSVVSADVAEDFYRLADESGVTIEQFTCTGISRDTLEGIPVSQTAVTVVVTGTLEEVVGFVINANTSFRTGYVASATLSMETPPEPELDAESLTSANIRVIIYSYQESGG